jgi:MFS family permease
MSSVRRASSLHFSYLGDVDCLDPFLLWSYASIVAGLALSIAPLIAPNGITSLSILCAVHAFALAAPNALGNVIMIEVVGIHRYAMAYGLSLLVSGSTSLFAYPLLGQLSRDFVDSSNIHTGLGWLKDLTQSWTIPFALVGSLMIVGGLVVGMVSLRRCCERKTTK